MQVSAHSSRGSVTAKYTTTTNQVPSGMGATTPSQCYRSVEEPTSHEDYDGFELQHSIPCQKMQSTYYDYSYDPEGDFGEKGSIL